MYDFTVARKLPTFIAAKVEPQLSSYIVQDYFYGKNSSKQPRYSCFTITNKKSELVVERCQKHLCVNSRFVKNFKSKYEA